MNRPDLAWSDDLLVVARSVRDAFRTELVARGIPGTVNLVGGLSGPDLLTKGDVDLHLCVAPDRFGAATDELAAWLAPASVDAWSGTLQVFALPDAEGLPVGLAVTPHDSEHDRRFRGAWRAIRDSEELRRRYNGLKRADVDGYEPAKSAFFDELEAHHQVETSRSGPCPEEP